MTRTLWKDFFKEIRATLPRYLSILFIVALGVAFFSGVRAADPDMRRTVDAYYDDMNFLDIRVISTLGLTDEDVAAIREVEGVTDAEGMYSLDVFLQDGDTAMVSTVQSLTGDISRYYISEGRLPETDGECLLDEAFLMYGDYEIGDVITLRSGTSDDLSDTLARTEFTIVGFGINPMYLSWDRTSASIGNGKVIGFVAVTPDAFVTDTYTQIFVTADQADPLTAMTDEYEEEVGKVVDAIQEIAGERCEIRYHDLTDEPYEELEKSKQEVEDGWQEVADAKQELEDAYNELVDGEEQIAEAKVTLAEAEATIAANEELLVSSQKQLDEAQAQYDAGLAEYQAGVQALAEAQNQLTDARITVGVSEQTLSTYREALTSIDDYLRTYEGDYNTAAGHVNSLGSSGRDSVYGKDLMKGYSERLLSGSASLPVWTGYLDDLLAAGQISEETHEELSALSLEELAELLADYAAMAAYEEASSLLASYEAQIAEGESLLNDGKGELDAAEQTVADSQTQLDAAERELVAAYVQLALAREEIASGTTQLEEAKQELADGQAELEENEQTLRDGWAEYYANKDDAEQQIADAEQELADAEQEIADAESTLAALEDPSWYVLDRANGVQSYVEYSSDADRIGSVGRVFPAIFFLVAALVSLTSMTRMVEERRTQIGTLKALGYGKGAIAAKYLLYALSASLIGSILGAALGEWILPQVILMAYGMLYLNLPYRMTPFNLNLAVMSSAIAIACIVIATLAATLSELMTGPAELMRPAAPKQGKRVFLERLPFLWKRLSFSWKATVRNLFRYKKRFFMTIFGIGGCMALLMVGFGLRDSIHAIIDNQYTTIWVYDAGAEVDDSAGEEALDALYEEVSSLDNVASTLWIRQTSIDVEGGGITKTVYLFVPETTENLEDFIILKDRLSGEHFTLDNDGVIINEKLSNMLGLSAGDTITIEDGETRRYTATITAVSENYLYNFVYMTPAVYESLYGSAPAYNNIYMNFEEDSLEIEDEMSEVLLSYDDISNVTMVTSLHESISSMMSALDLVVWVLIIAAGLLAFVVLYNLNNVNIEERRRELATLKVLGFYPMEVAAYVYRENVLLTVLGVIFGAVFGFFLHRYMILTLEIDMLMFGRQIRPSSYLLSTLITFLFAVVINAIMYFSLKKIDMVESMKSVE